MQASGFLSVEVLGLLKSIDLDTERPTFRFFHVKDRGDLMKLSYGTFVTT